MASRVTRTDLAIYAEIDAAEEQVTEGSSSVPGMTYEEGVSTALRWVIGDSDDAPMSNE